MTPYNSVTMLLYNWQKSRKYNSIKIYDYHHILLHEDLDFNWDISCHDGDHGAAFFHVFFF